MKKKLNTDAIQNELADSIFFSRKKEAPEVPVSAPLLSQRTETTPQADTVVSRYHDIMVPSNHDITIPETEDEMLEAIRKSVKKIGKEAATQRLTLEEKNTLRSIKFTYEQLGVQTSGNEIIRIGMLFVLNDYQKNGENSILAKVLKRLNF